jgi:hypothetical protein
MRSIRSLSLLRRKIPQLNRGYKLEVYFSPSSRFSARASGLFQHPISEVTIILCVFEKLQCQSNHVRRMEIIINKTPPDNIFVEEQITLDAPH